MRTGAAAVGLAAALGFSSVGRGDLGVSVDPPAVVQGSWTVLRTGGGEGPGRAEWLGRRVPLFPVAGGWRALLAVPLDARVGPAQVRVRLRGQEQVARVTILRRDTGPRVTLKGINVSPESLATLSANHDSVVPLLATASPQAWWSGPLRRPVPGIVSSPFGPTRGYGGAVTMPHKGVDFAMHTGMPVVAMAAGVVVLARRMTSYGNCVIIDHGQSVHSTSMHMTALAVRVGDRVEAGQIIGTVGATGMAKGAHLHFGTSIGTIAVDPLDMLARGLP